GNSATSPFSASASGTYTIVATDANGCTDTKQVTITIPTKVELTANGTNPLCFGGSGSITFSATGGTGTKTYTVNGNSATSPFSASASGTYTIVATDANGCTDTKQVTITIPTKVELTANGTNPLCFGGSGSITFSATGGTGTKTYTVNGNSATSPFSASASGTYTIVATDANGCTDTKQVTITIPTKVELTANGTNPLCFGGSGSITFSATGGTGDKTYTVNGNSATSPFSASASGTYTIVATDANGCTDTKQVTITIPTKVELTANGTNPLCFGGSGSITFSATGGTGTKTFTVNGNSATSPFSASASGTYTIVATDANGCTDTKQVTIVIPTEVVVSLTSLPEICANTATGSVQATFSGGTGVYMVSIDGGAFTAQTSPYTFASLNSGSHTVVVKDANGCEDMEQINVGLIPCDAFCTYTQGAYGSAGGAMCDGENSHLTTAQAIAQCLSNAGGTITVGQPGRSVFMTAPGAVSCIIDKLPGGGPAKELPAGNNSICSLPSSLLKNGRISNVLLSQTITLALNSKLSLENDLSAFTLQAGTFAVASPQGGCGSKIAKERICGHYNEAGVWVNTVNEYTYKTFPASVLNAITADANGNKTVAGLIDLANRALGNADGIVGSEAGVSLSAINGAIDALNVGFDECKIFIGWNVEKCPSQPLVRVNASSDKEFKGLSVVVAPNPYTDNFKLSLTTVNSAQVNISVYDMTGRLIEKRDLNPSEVSEIQVGNNYSSGVYNVIVTQGEEVKTQRVIKK
ncbi:T9SS type A sorting domain-containing protein, partial [Flavobacterium silvisoli]